MGQNLDLKIVNKGQCVCIKEFSDKANGNHFKSGNKYNYELTYVATETDKYYIIEDFNNQHNDEKLGSCVSIFDDVEYPIFFCSVEEYRVKQLNKII